MVIIKLFDNMKNQFIGYIYLPMQGGKNIININTYFMYKKLPCNILLGRSLIYAMGVIPFTLHICIRFEKVGKMHTIKVEDDLKSMIGITESTFVPFNEMEDTKRNKKKELEADKKNENILFQGRIPPNKFKRHW